DRAHTGDRKPSAGTAHCVARRRAARRRSQPPGGGGPFACHRRHHRSSRPRRRRAHDNAPDSNGSGGFRRPRRRGGTFIRATGRAAARLSAAGGRVLSWRGLNQSATPCPGSFAGYTLTRLCTLPSASCAPCRVERNVSVEPCENLMVFGFLVRSALVTIPSFTF